MSKRYKVEVDMSNVRLDLFLSSKLPDFSRTAIQYSIKSNLVTVNDKIAKTSTKLNIGDVIQYEIKSKEINNEIIPQNINLDIIFEDKSIIVINKPSGLIVRPGSGNRDNTLVNGLAYHYKKLSKVNNLRPGIIHRLDKDTSGVMVVAKTDSAHIKISEQFANRSVKKIYHALVWGKIQDRGIIEGFITRNNFDRTKFKMSDSKGKSSKTTYRLENYFEPISLVELQPKTGRTHQIRVHLNSIGHPIFSDDAYSGGKKRIKSYHVKYMQRLKRLFKLMERVALHASTIEFTHPENNEKVSFSVPFPDDFKSVLGLLENE